MRKKKKVVKKKVEEVEEKRNDIAPDDPDVYDENDPYGLRKK